MVDSWVEIKYASLISSRLRNFKIKKRTPYLANFSCPYCGDSKKNLNKARGYFLTQNNHIFFKCHNCDKACTLYTFIKDLDPEVAKKYIFDGFKQKLKPEIKEEYVKPPTPQIFSSIKIGTPIKSLPNDHEAIKYLENRQIPKEKYGLLYYVEKMEEVKETFPDYNWEKMPNDSRIIFPIKNRKSELIGISARALNKSKLRYIILKRNDDEPMIFNLDKVDPNQKIYVTEGAFDSFFLPNSLAVDGADFSKLENLFSKENMVVVFDNEPRNREITQRVEKAIDAGYSLVIWPSYSKEYGKDINEMIQSGVSNEKILSIINENVYSGLRAKLALSTWRK